MAEEAPFREEENGECEISDLAEPPFPPLLETGDWATARVRFGLTPREIEVCELLARGATERIVCGKLGIERPTLRSHITQIHRKLACRRQVEVILKLVHEIRDASRVTMARPNFTEPPP